MFGCALVLVACGNGEPPQQLPRPVMVVQPQPASEARESYPGEVHARYEPELAFRIGGKVVERLVEAGDRVRKDQPLARLDPQDVRLQLDGMRAPRSDGGRCGKECVRTCRSRWTTYH